MRPNSARFHWTNSFYIVIFGLNSELRSILSSLEIESEAQGEAQGQFLIDSCCLVSQSNYLKHLTSVVIG